MRIPDDSYRHEDTVLVPQNEVLPILKDLLDRFSPWHLHGKKEVLVYTEELRGAGEMISRKEADVLFYFDLLGEEESKCFKDNEHRRFWRRLDLERLSEIISRHSAAV